MKNKVLIFDLDGTILDTFLLIEKTVFKTFEEKLSNYPLTKEEAHSFFGPLLDYSFKKYGKNQEEVDDLVSTYRRINYELMEEYTRLYDRIDEVIITLKQRGYIIGILSNKKTDAVVKGLDIFHIRDLFDFIIGADQLIEPKPDPRGIYDIIEKYSPIDIYMIGDTIIDIKTGQNAGVKTIGVTWCKTSKSEFIKNNTTYIVEKPIELLEVLGG